MSLQRPGFAAQSSVVSDLADFRQDAFQSLKRIRTVEYWRDEVCERWACAGVRRRGRCRDDHPGRCFHEIGEERRLTEPRKRVSECERRLRIQA